MKSNGSKGMWNTLALLPLVLGLPACDPPLQPMEPGAPPAVVINGPIGALVLDGLAYPRHQFEIASPDRCNASHWHSHKVVYSIGRVGTLGSLADRRAIACHPGNQFPGISDPDPGGCGFGRKGEVIELDIYVEKPCSDAFYQVAPIS
jgi:hypothetical protein